MCQLGVQGTLVANTIAYEDIGLLVHYRPNLIKADKAEQRKTALDKVLRLDLCLFSCICAHTAYEERDPKTSTRDCLEECRPLSVRYAIITA